MFCFILVCYLGLDADLGLNVCLRIGCFVVEFGFGLIDLLGVFGVWLWVVLMFCWFEHGVCLVWEFGLFGF